MKTLKKGLDCLFKVVDIFNKSALFLSIAGFTLLCLAQVICRYVFNNSLTWSEQACRYLFCITTFLGASLCVLEKSHTTIDILAEFLSAKWKCQQSIGIHSLIFVFSLILASSGWTLMSKSMNQSTTTLPFTMGQIYMIIPVSAVIMAFNALRVIAADLVELADEKREDDGL